MLTDTEVTDKLVNVFRDVFDDDAISLRESMTARDIEGWDSVANIRLMLSIEEMFGFRFDAGEFSEMRNVGDIIASVRRHME